VNQIILNNVSISYTQPLFSDLSITIPSGWTGISGPNGCGKSSLADFIRNSLSGISSPEKEGRFTGEIKGPPTVRYLPQLPVPRQEDLFDFFYSGGNENRLLASLLELQEEWIYSLDEISFGEKRRLQIALALSEHPDVLILDEPENHLDSAGKKLAIETLKTYGGIGIIIGHSRDIMNSLCRSTLLIYQGRWHWYQSTLSEALDLYRREEESAGRQRQNLKRQISRQKQTLQTYSSRADKAEKSLSKKRLAPGDRDGKGAIDLARLTGADKSASRKVALQKNLIRSTAEILENTGRDRYIKLGLTVEGGKSRRDRLISLPAGEHELFPGFSLVLPELTVGSEDRIVITGRNGSGKSSLLKYMSLHLAAPLPWEWIPQEMDKEGRESLWSKFEVLNDRERADVLAYFSRMASNPSQLVREMKASPGETKKLNLAMTFLNYSELILMDEPSNHLDIFSIQVLEEALAGYPGALVFVSHEENFCRSVVNRRWHIDNGTVTVVEQENVGDRTEAGMSILL